MTVERIEITYDSHHTQKNKADYPFEQFFICQVKVIFNNCKKGRLY